LAKLNRQWQAAILDYLEDLVTPLDNPRSRGKPLVSTLRDCGAIG